MEKHKFISRILIMLAFIATAITSTAQENGAKRRHFSPEEFQAKQQEYITSKAGLTQAEADAFFPLFFELQKKKFELERNVRKEVSIRKAHEMNEEQCSKFVSNMADVKIEIAKLEKEYTAKYLKVLPACKLMRVQFAETSFQRDLMKKMMRPRDIDERMERKGVKK
ncbi:MAG: hypothetical protein IKY37_06070 [Bacteroidaceae bacterium]|nr:hypothetical protein [Bacteroidaceae bacterium]